jgi:hypothetical protein
LRRKRERLKDARSQKLPTSPETEETTRALKSDHTLEEKRTPGFGSREAGSIFHNPGREMEAEEIRQHHARQRARGATRRGLPSSCVYALCYHRMFTIVAIFLAQE